MNTQDNYTLINRENGHLAFKIFSLDDDTHFNQVQRNNYYSLIWILKGNGKIRVDFTEYDFKEDYMYCFSPYQPFIMDQTEIIEGIVLQFHPDFFCIHKHQPEVACNGVLFNNIYQPPYVIIGKEESAILRTVVEQMKVEIRNPALAQHELIVSYLKIFLINTSRLKSEQQPQVVVVDIKEPFVLQNLKDAIERDFKFKHAASDYAKDLNISQKALAKIAKTHFNKTLTELISERIIIEAKRELYLSNKPIKEIAYELGYEDEHYFSRFFKVNTDISPLMYRNTVGVGKADE
jgi:AraC-like DNA-binding protein